MLYFNVSISMFQREGNPVGETITKILGVCEAIKANVSLFLITLTFHDINPIMFSVGNTSM